MNKGTACANGELAAIIENSESLIWAVDKDYRYTVYNTRYYRWLDAWGVQVALQDSALHPIFPEDVIEKWREWYDTALSGGVLKKEERYVGPLGESVVHDFHFTPITKCGHVYGVSCMATDVTSFRDTEEELRAARDRNLRAVKELIKDPLSLLKGS